MVVHPTPVVPLLFLALSAVAVSADTHGSNIVVGNGEDEKKKTVAIIGGGIGGTFAAKFLAEYDTASSSSPPQPPCALGSIDLFDPSPQLSASADATARGGNSGATHSGGGSADPERQGSRVSSLALSDGTTVELGASVIFGGNRYVTDQVDSDPALMKAPPGSTGKQAASDPGGFGVYDVNTNGDGVWDVLIWDDEPDWKVALRLGWRYNLDLLKMRNAVKSAFESFKGIYDLLDGSAVFHSPDEMWMAVGLYDTTTMAFDEYLDTIGISGSSKRREQAEVAGAEWSWWRAILAFFLPGWDGLSRLVLPGHGNLRREILDAVNINNYNQANDQLDGLAGLVSFIPTLGNIYCVREGNGQILTSAFRSAREIHAAECGGGIGANPNEADSGGGDGDDGAIRHVRATVTTVVYGPDGIEVWGRRSNEEGGGEAKLGDYDVVILAAPLKHCRIAFRSWDAGGALRPLRTDGPTEATGDDDGGSCSGTLPPSAARAYAQTVTTVVGNATLQRDRFGLSGNDPTPSAISVTARGREREGLSAMARLTDDGTFKVFSPEPLTEEQLGRWFGPHYVVRHVQVWGGPHGGAYPDFAGGGEAVRSAPFLLHGHDGSVRRGRGGMEGSVGEERGMALFYVNAVEASVAAVEISAIGAKAVAKLAARRLGMVRGLGGA